MVALIVVAVVLGLILLTVLPGWLRQRRMGADDYAINYDPVATKRERRQAIRNWRSTDHTGRR